MQISTRKREACLTGVLGASGIVTWIFTHTNCKLCTLGVIGTKRYAYNFIVIFREYWLKIQTCRTTFWWAKRHIVICLAKLKSITFDTGQQQILTNVTKSPLWHKSYCWVCCFVQRSQWTLLLGGWRRTSHHSHIATLQIDDQWISSPKASTKQTVVSIRWCYGPHSGD